MYVFIKFIVDRNIVDNSMHEQMDDEYLHMGCDETLLNNTQVESITLVPGENQVPRSVLFDPHAEELSFPSIFCGQIRQLKVKLSYHQVVKSALRNYQRKCARVDHLFFIYKKLELLRCSKSPQIQII